MNFNSGIVSLHRLNAFLQISRFIPEVRYGIPINRNVIADFRQGIAEIQEGIAAFREGIAGIRESIAAAGEGIAGIQEGIAAFRYAIAGIPNAIAYVKSILPAKKSCCVIETNVSCFACITLVLTRYLNL